MTRLRSWLTPPMLVALLALVIALGGTSYAAMKLPRNSVGSLQVKNGSIASVDVKDRSLRATDFAPGQLKPGPPEAWRTLPLEPDWGSYGGARRPQFLKDQTGFVHLRGFVSKTVGSPEVFEPIGTLPVGYRPSEVQYFPVATGSSVGPGLVAVYDSGQVVWVNGPKAEQDYTELSGVSFYPN